MRIEKEEDRKEGKIERKKERTRLGEKGREWK